ncbi:MAG: TetR/AcrR family transcriptional regulator [Microscillaceae bacterium]|nr:TetR/AcrR family transcriptional regulator [Microscillaceae bacterium]
MKKESTPVKERIIDTASRLFYMQGYNATGINQVIEEAKIAKSSLYQHFATKEDLAVAYLVKTNTEWFRALGEFIKKGNSPKDKVLLTFDFLEVYQASCQFRGCNFQNISAELPQDNTKILTEVRKQKVASRAYFHQLLATTDKTDFADEIFILFEGAIVTSRIYQDTWAIEEAKKRIMNLL